MDRWENTDLKRLASGVQLPSLATKSLTFNNVPLVLDPIHRMDIS